MHQESGKSVATLPRRPSNPPGWLLSVKSVQKKSFGSFAVLKSIYNAAALKSIYSVAALKSISSVATLKIFLVLLL